MIADRPDLAILLVRNLEQNHLVERIRGEASVSTTRIVEVGDYDTLRLALSQQAFDLVLMLSPLEWIDEVFLAESLEAAHPDQRVRLVSAEPALALDGSRRAALEADRRFAYEIRSALQQSRRERSLRTAEHRSADPQTDEARATPELEAVFRALPDLYFRLDAEGRILDYLAGRKTDLYVTPEVFLGSRMFEVLPPDVGERWREAIATTMTRQEIVTIEYSLPIAADEAIYEARLSPLGNDQVVAVVRNVTEHRRQSERVAYLANHDHLTGLLNRRAFETVLRTAIERSAAGERSTLLFADVDGFKRVNDLAGHAAGDQALVMIARSFEESVRHADTIARLGGDEFAVLLANVDVAEARPVTERLQQGLGDREVSFAGRAFRIGVSVGVAAVLPSSTPGEILAQADAAMYQAKRKRIRRTQMHWEGPARSHGARCLEGDE